ASGHTIAATLLYGQLLLFLLPLLKTRHSRVICIFSAASLVFVVGFSRVALGAHFLTDVLAAMFFGTIWLMLCMVLGKSMQRRTVALATSPQPAQTCAVKIGHYPLRLPAGSWQPIGLPYNSNSSLHPR